MLPDNVIIGEPTTACSGTHPIGLTWADPCVEAGAAFRPFKEFCPKALPQEVPFGQLFLRRACRARLCTGTTTNVSRGAGGESPMRIASIFSK
jgi:hypothetical protein